MKFKVFLGLAFLNAAIGVSAQQPEPQTTPQKSDDSTTAAQNSNGYVRPDGKTRRKNYVKSIFGPVALGKLAVSAGYSTARNSPAEWGGTWEGFGRRVASGFGKNVIKQTTQFGLDEAFRLDSKFYRSRNRNFGARVKNALVSTVTARNEAGRRVFGFPRIVGTYTASIIAAETWYPKRFSYKNGLRSGTVSLGLNAAFNLIKEFVKK